MIGGFSGPAATPQAPGRLTRSSGGESDKAQESRAPNERADSLRRKVKRIGNKTFYWNSGEWQEAAIASQKTPPSPDNITTIEQFSDAWFKLSQKDDGKWKLFLSQKEPLLLKVNKTLTRITPKAN